MNILVLGCGPAGLLAVHAAIHAHGGNSKEAHERGLRIGVISKRRKSPLYGAQYLHAEIPGLSLPDPVEIKYRMRGSVDDYRQKVYGSGWDGTVSPEDLDETHMGWDLRRAYDMLWAKYWHLIMDIELQPRGMSSVLSSGADLVINTIPRHAICKGGHFFNSTEVWAAGDAPDLGIDLQKYFQSIPDNSVVCNGDDSPSWYRMSRIYNHMTVEWPGALDMVPIITASKATKPTGTNCDCWPDIVHVGRYGAWKKGVLTHHVFDDVTKIVAERLVKA